MNRTERTDLYIHIYVVSEAYNSNFIHVSKSVCLCLCVSGKWYFIFACVKSTMSGESRLGWTLPLLYFSLFTCHWPWAAAAPDTVSRPACLCRWALFGNARPAGPANGTCVVQCNTCSAPHAPGSACCGQVPSGKPSNRPSVKHIRID